MAVKDDINKKEALKSSVTFHYLKSQQFRVIHTDGAIVGITPSGHIHMALFSERPAIAREITHAFEGGKLGDVIEQETVSRAGYVREMDVDAMLDLQTAKDLCTLLTQKVKEFEEIFQSKDKK